MTVAAADHLCPLARRGQPLLQALAGKVAEKALRQKSKKAVVYRKWYRNLEYGWSHWEDQHQEWASLEGEEYLPKALSKGKGAVLLSGHKYGFSGLVAPLLAKKGYLINRTGYEPSARRESRWGRDSDKRFQYIDYRGDYWHHLRILKELRQTVKRNEVVHISIRGLPQGDPKLEIDFCYKRFCLDPIIFRVLEILQAPVLPCFALCDGWRVAIKIHPALEPSTEKIMDVFGPLYAGYLKEFPEFAYFWERIILQRENW